MTATSLLPPPVMWAQRKQGVFLTICLEDCKDPSIQLNADKIHFKGAGGADKKEYEMDLEVFEPIDPEKSTHRNTGRVIEFELKKATDNFWPRLTKSNEKKHWIKVDFSRWKDEDDSDDEAEAGPGGMPGMGGMGMGGMPGMGGMGGMGGGTDFEEMMRQMGGLSGGGLGGAGGLGDKPSLDDLDKETDSDDDDDELPDLE
ncbi:Protein wos2 [Orchesella cincta]|uniref:Protein wos2 n=1 Tax=Orchesella cincta TaxID=48709 RepID=A0A1D2NDR6_ORCCI|nr:Protein wos2 [Orchesella cincta]